MCAIPLLRGRLGFIPAPVDQSAGQDHIDLQRGETMPGPHWSAAVEGDVLTALERAAQIVDTQDIALVQSVVVGLVDESQGQNPVVDEILAVNTRKILRQHDPETQISRRRRGMLARRALAIVAACYYGVARRRGTRALDIAPIDTLKGEIADFLDVRAIGRTLAPAGRISSVETSSFIFKRIGTVSWSGS